MKSLLTIIFLISTSLYAANDEPHPVIDSNYISKYSYNIKDMGTKNLKEARQVLKNHLKELNYENDIDFDAKLLESLLQYDDIRIQIVDVIDKIIIEYNVSNDIKKTLLSFQDTFKHIIKDNRSLVNTLRDYKAYDFRLGSAYLAMMSAFHDTDERKLFYTRLVEDKTNTKTEIGAYNKKLRDAQENVNLVKSERENFEEIIDIKNTLKKIENEIKKRD